MRLLTGFPGFLGSEFIKRTLHLTPDSIFICLVQEKFKELAERKKKEILIQSPLIQENQIQIVLGDITLSGLGLKDLNLKPITTIDHFAAVYDLNVSERVGSLINIQGTQNVLQWAQQLPLLDRMNYVSTCYVSGHHPGLFRETDLELGQKFNNFYESTKFEAEKLVRNEMKQGLNASIYRPSVVVGNSITGETQKFDGPYYVVQWLMRQGSIAILPEMGNPKNYFINLVPSNFVIDALVYLSGQKFSDGKTYQLADPAPMTVADVIQILGINCKKQVIPVRLPKNLVKTLMKYLPALEAWVGIPRSSLDYFVHPTHYGTEITEHSLKDSGIQCPKFSSYSQKLVDYWVQNPGIRKQALI
jgi:thioester reductase-like protein